MIKKILEKNGESINLTDSISLSNYGYNSNIYDIHVNHHAYTVIAFNDNEAEEKACRQYVRENGFKLEWLRDYISFSCATMTNYEILYAMSENYMSDTKALKLIAWLYANDIKIVED